MCFSDPYDMDLILTQKMMTKLDWYLQREMLTYITITPGENMDHPEISLS